MCLLLTCIKGNLVLLLDKTGYVSQETRPKFIDSQVHLWPIEDICFGMYVLEHFLKVWYILEKVMSMQHSFEEFSEKQGRVELKSVGKFVAKAVLAESANQFLFEELCRTQYNLKYFSKP